MHSLTLRATFAAGLAIVCHAQEDRDNNKAVGILTCNDLDQIQLDSGTVCNGDQIRATGVGIAPNVFSFNDTSLSLTLVDDATEGSGGAGYYTSTQTLYAGVPSDFDASAQPPACALMLQYQAQTLPNMPNTPDDNSTSCSDVLFDPCLDTLTQAVQTFDYNNNNGSATGAPPRCDMLAVHVRSYLMPNLSFCGLWTNYVNITGGPIFGSNASTEVVQLQQSGGQPVSPAEYELHRAASMAQLFRPGGDEFPDAVSDANEGLNEPVRGAGRQGTTPVIGVFYRSEEDTKPTVDFACMRIFTPEGEQLPNQLNYHENGAVVRGVGYAAVALSVAMLLQSVL